MVQPAGAGLADSLIGFALHFFQVIICMPHRSSCFFQVAITAGIDFALANHLSAMITLSNGHILTQQELLMVYGGERNPIPTAL
jgi:hypothetical protein